VAVYVTCSPTTGVVVEAQRAACVVGWEKETVMRPLSPSWVPWPPDERAVS
jgi:hypothetical protein